MIPTVGTEVSVRSWIKAVMYGVTLVVGTVGMLEIAYQSHSTTESRVISIGFGLITLGFSCWLFRRLYFLCSVAVSESGVEQSSLSLRPRFTRRVFLDWDSVETVDFRDRSFHFVGKDGTKMELDVGLFNSADVTFRAVHDLLPERLKLPA